MQGLELTKEAEGVQVVFTLIDREVPTLNPVEAKGTKFTVCVLCLCDCALAFVCV